MSLTDESVEQEWEFEEAIKIDRFALQMKTELIKNRHKGTILEYDDFDSIIAEMEYHKSKMFMAIRSSHTSALKEYIADVANFLFALGNCYGLYEVDDEQLGICHELNKDNLIIIKSLEDKTIVTESIGHEPRD